MSTTARSAELAEYARVTVGTYSLLAERSGGSALESAGMVLASGPDPAAAILNVAFRVDPTVPANEVLDRARAHYEPGGFRFAIASSAHTDADIDLAAAAGGWEKIIFLPAMVCRTRLADRPAPPGAALRAAHPTRDRDAFGAIAAVCFSDDDDEAAAYRIVFQSDDLFRDGCAAFIASVDGEDVAGAWVSVIGAAATVGWVGTLPQFRRRGLGDLVTRAVTNAAFEMGANLVTLQASPSGEPVYARMGYETISSETLWAPAATLGPRET